ncbi:hypothetical protein TNIN_447551 [Trichonephila inaurata madagascariensis]|uniref:Uncharacterized protein n=1 Tax=Trichonephila inaurata madagascariensis TaxID=2747483 RepID=A0A8X7C6U3_9ARAC|nr:hypothetical protein TNIN_447551 [Trichonephila inaurata madagascariensis]
MEHISQKIALDKTRSSRVTFVYNPVPRVPNSQEREFLAIPPTYYIKEQSGQELDEHRPSAELTEAEKIALLGKPRLGDNYKIQLRIKESKEFKNTVDKLFEKTNASLTIGTSSWKEQFLDVITVSAGLFSFQYSRSRP